MKSVSSFSSKEKHMLTDYFSCYKLTTNQPPPTLRKIPQNLKIVKLLLHSKFWGI